MNRIVIALPLVLGLMAFAGPLPPPLTPANDGKLLCTKPDTGARTCESLTRYSATDTEIVETHSISVLDEEMSVVMEGAGRMEIKDGEVCERTRPEHAENYKVTIRPGANTLLTAKMYKDFLVATVRAGQHHELCMRFVPNGDETIIKYIFNGAQSRLPDERAIWVLPEDGYRVAP